MPTTSSIEKSIVPVELSQPVHQLSPEEHEYKCRCFIRLLSAELVQPKQCNQQVPSVPHTAKESSEHAAATSK